MKPSLTLYVFGAALAVIWFAAPSQAQQSSVGQTSPQVADPHGWLGTETVKTKFGDFEFKNGYPTPAAADALLDQLKLNRAIEVYLTQIPTVAIFAEHLGLADFGAKRPNQMVIWEQLMDAETLLLTPNTETVYALGHLDLKTDGPTVVDAPPKMLGFAMDARQPISSTSACPDPTRAKAANICSSHRGTPAKCRRVTSSSNHRPLSSASGCAALKSTAKPTKPWRS